MREIYTKKEEKDWLSLKKAKKIIFLFIDIRKSLSMISTKDFFSLLIQVRMIVTKGMS